YYDSWEGVRIGGWLLEPAEGPVTGAIVMGHGYGGREEPEYEWLMPQMAAIFPCARGFHLSACAGIPSVAAEHVVHRIESREDYVIRGCAADLWLAASAVLELYPQVRDNLLYIGGSFGGGMGALMLSVDKRFRRAYLNIPTFGHHPLRITLPCVGSGAAVRSYYLEGHPEVLDVLAYYDAAVAAGFIEIPVYVAAALFDPAVPPPGQFAVYNMLSHHKELFLRQADHFELEGNQYDNACVRTRVRRFFRD
ncbi:MAG: acetylxylan esterase, partial [Puniceicoccales bacterium]